MQPIETIHSFDKEEERILKSTGIPPVFANLLKEKSQVMGIAFALRATSPMQRYLMPASPKPLSVKTKTGNWSFTKGVISVDNELGKIEKKNGKWQLVPRHEDDLPKTPGIIEPVLHRLSLQEILTGLHNGEYQQCESEEDIYQSGELILKAVGRLPDNSNIIFRINFKEDKSRIEKQCEIDFSKILITIPKKEPRPVWWNDDWGDFNECLDHYYPAQYKNIPHATFNDIMVYGVADETGKVLPITGDQDLLWVSIPSKRSDFFKDFEEVIDSSDIDNVAKLYKIRLALQLKLGENVEEAEKSIRSNSIAGVGRISAYESYVIDNINSSFSACGIKHLRDLIQHAAENHNIEHPSPIDARMVHIWNGKISMTYTENEMIKFVMQPIYPKENIININPKWDMAKWAVVISIQLSLNQPVPSDTLAAYKKYRDKNKKMVFFGMDKQIDKRE